MSTSVETARSFEQPPSPLPGLPPTFNPLLGREEEAALIQRALREDGIRLLTLAGPPGIGKTRLAIEVAEAVAPAFPDGICFVDLAGVSDPASVPLAIIEILGGNDDAGLPPLARLQQHLHNRHLLIVLDTFEHVLPAATLVGDLLTSHPSLSLLVTSREPLRLKWEHTMTVSPLALPPLARGKAANVPVERSSDQAMDAFLELASVQLFLQRARATRLDFTVTPENVQEIAAICVQVEGVPLAIELAAGWVHLLPPSAILEYLRSHSSFLHSWTHDVPERQQSLETTLDWSYKLLSRTEQALLRRLSVCQSSFSLDAAAAIAGDIGLDVLEGLTRLVDKSLLQSETAAGEEARFRLPEAVQAYGLERLKDGGEVQEARRRHVQYFLALAEHA